MKIEDGIKLDFDDVLIKPKRAEHPSRSTVVLERKFNFKHGTSTDMYGIPIIAANMDTTGSFAMAKELSKMWCFTALHKFYKEEELVNYFERTKRHKLNTFYTLGINDNDFNLFKNVIKEVSLQLICIDVANGYMQSFVDFVAKIRELSPYSIIMAGNVATPEMTQELIINGKADIIKIGIGPGSACTTRLKTGVGVPQLSAIAECADVAHGLKAHVCADGGCKNSGDIAKAFGAGADFVMLGGLLAGTEECEGRWVYNHDYYPLDKESMDTRAKKVKLFFHGMSSREAMDQHGGWADYKTAEGVEISVPYKGAVKEVMQNLLGGLRGSCALTGASCLKDMARCTTFQRVNRTKEYLYDIRNG